jgi:hypothetical protein
MEKVAGGVAGQTSWWSIGDISWILAGSEK